jgi:transcription elongation GreA/GreB family factor
VAVESGIRREGRYFRLRFSMRCDAAKPGVCGFGGFACTGFCAVIGRSEAVVMGGAVWIGNGRSAAIASVRRASARRCVFEGAPPPSKQLARQGRLEMSRAFVKEVDDAPSPLLERAVSAAPNRVTPRGARLINEAVATLNKQLATSTGEAASVIRRDLRYWLARQANTQVVTPDPQPRAVGFGSRATIRRAAVSNVTIVGEDEADPPTGLIAWTAPLARALEGAEPGDVVELQAGGRRQSITVVAVVAGE